MPGMVAIGFIAYLLIHPVPQKYHGPRVPWRSGNRVGETEVSAGHALASGRRSSPDG